MIKERHIRSVSRGGWSLIDLLTFILAAAVIYPIAKAISTPCEGAWRNVVFYSIMIVVYPVCGVAFIVARERLISIFTRKNRSDISPDSKTTMKDSQSGGRD